jgi:hypothetical protein
MITRERLAEFQARIAYGRPLHSSDVVAMIDMLWSHPAVAPELQPQSTAAPAGCSFPQCHCVQACASYVRARS